MSYQHSKCSDILNYKHISEMVESNIQDRNIGWVFSRFLSCTVFVNMANAQVA